MADNRHSILVHSTAAASEVMAVVSTTTTKGDGNLFCAIFDDKTFLALRHRVSPALPKPCCATTCSACCATWGPAPFCPKRMHQSLSRRLSCQALTYECPELQATVTCLSLAMRRAPQGPLKLPALRT